MNENRNTLSISAADILSKIDGPIVWRPQAAKMAGWKPKTMANLDAAGRGCPGKIRHGNCVGYRSQEFASWLADRLEPVQNKGE